MSLMWMSYMKNRSKKKHVRRRRVSDKKNIFIDFFFFFISALNNFAIRCEYVDDDDRYIIK